MMIQQSEFAFTADPQEFLATLAAQHPVAPSVGLGAAAASDILLEVRGVRALLARHDTGLSACFSLGNGTRLYAREIAETLVSVASTASLAAFLRPGEEWRVPGIALNSRRALRLEAELCLLRADLAHRAPGTSRFLQARMGDEHSANMRRAYALLLLALDAVGGRLQREVIDAAKIGHTGDPQGDAQLVAEEHLAQPRVPLWIDADE